MSNHYEPRMKVLFLQNIKGVAQIGDIKNISDGYARNFLLPRKLATIATSDAIKRAEVLKQRRTAEDMKSNEQALELAKKLEGGVVELFEGANPEGHLYGSVDAKKIAHAIKETYRVAVSEDQIDLPHHIKTTGEHSVTLKLYATIETTLTVRVLPS